MKKSLLIFVITISFFFGCSTSEDNTTQNDNSTINPPEWIRGVWLAGTWIDAGYEIASDDFCFIE